MQCVTLLRMRRNLRLNFEQTESCTPDPTTGHAVIALRSFERQIVINLRSSRAFCVGQLSCGTRKAVVGINRRQM